VLCINHEFGRNTHVLGKGFPESLEDVRISQAAHGVSCVEIKDDAGNWVSLVDSPYNRRITPNTPSSSTARSPARPCSTRPSALRPPAP